MARVVPELRRRDGMVPIA